jgi:hypothetical protein
MLIGPLLIRMYCIIALFIYLLVLHKVQLEIHKQLPRRYRPFLSLLHCYIQPVNRDLITGLTWFKFKWRFGHSDGLILIWFV